MEHIYIACGYTDLRRGIDGLAQIIQNQFSLDPCSNSLFLFCGRRRDRIKALLWEGDGFVLLVEKYRNKEIAINKQNETFVSCFSEHSDSMVMWGIYANCHRGICVGYSLKELVEKFDCMPVIYEKTLPQYSDDTSALINTLTKYIDWEYEHEWRIVRFNKKYRMENGYKIDFVKPKEIILGLKSNDFLWRVDNTGTLSDEINPNKLIKYSEDILGTNCRQYQILTSDTGYTWDKIIRI
ncbi:MAG: IS66 family insertion sequence element accessory protein TnpB [Faecalibacterium sp.]|nr:IS66 family insertion sequence element accessory protein TnpB [Faecalibacterium sp.]